MPRKALLRTSDYPYHITNRSNNREYFYVDNNVLWGIFLAVLDEVRTQFKCEIHAFVLMSNHYHLIISTPECNIGEAMKYLHREVARLANKSANRINHFFGGRYKWSVISDENYYWNSIKYVFRNPVRAEICNRVEEYTYSSLVKDDDFPWSMADVFYKPNVPIHLDLDWLNAPFATETEEAIKKALRRRSFQIPTDQYRRKIILDAMPYKKGTVT